MHQSQVRHGCCDMPRCTCSLPNGMSPSNICTPISRVVRRDKAQPAFPRCAASCEGTQRRFRVQGFRHWCRLTRGQNRRLGFRVQGLNFRRCKAEVSDLGGLDNYHVQLNFFRAYCGTLRWRNEVGLKRMICQPTVGDLEGDTENRKQKRRKHRDLFRPLGVLGNRRKWGHKQPMRVELSWRAERSE
eukprot:2601144-Rhodomonas_salina.1